MPSVPLLPKYLTNLYHIRGYTAQHRFGPSLAKFPTNLYLFSGYTLQQVAGLKALYEGFTECSLNVH